MTRLAHHLIDHATGVMPSSRREWVRAMRAELAHIPSPLAATGFALGCVWAGYAQRIRHMLTLARLARLALAAYAAAGAGGYLLATALLGMVKATPGIKPQDLGSDPGVDRTLSFILAYPVWQLAAFAVIAVLLAAGAVHLVLRRPLALPLLAAGVVAATVIAILDRQLVGSGHGWPLAWSLTWLVPLACLAPVWWLSRRAPDLHAA